MRERELHSELKMLPSDRRRARLLEVAREHYLTVPQRILYNMNRLDFERMPKPPIDTLTEVLYWAFIVGYVLITTAVIASFGSTAYAPIVHAKWAETIIVAIILTYVICIPIKVGVCHIYTPGKLVKVLKDVESEPGYEKFKTALAAGLNLKVAVKAAVRGDEEAAAGDLTGADALRAAILAHQQAEEGDDSSLNVTLAQLAAQRKGAGAKQMAARMKMLGAAGVSATMNSAFLKDVKMVFAFIFKQIFRVVRLGFFLATIVVSYFLFYILFLVLFYSDNYLFQ